MFKARLNYLVRPSHKNKPDKTSQSSGKNRVKLIQTR